ncbi:class I SAM-dependent methyltransferase [Halapricum hydrolyticum]|uniref:Class I SAM-dependent methyltransferase n=1 Tax=Halapricum hydrolyticum TaxID=2979991 RepID=A0AAE3I9M5_9EURY|nr:class I SAM-dependent methyltransferase [Halapricum hydrolyticum]MCU4716478.1 class I SAM-dependent methyltransferase [Halapricum hydrolyticum]MCU4725917.1 class I SAM-dependent methyltransferase [Halapricum hydrolyticum]
MDAEKDAYGQAILDYYEYEDGFEIVERDDGFVAPSGGPEMYFSEYDDWGEHVQAAFDRLRGRVLDVGCGAGRHALHAQRQGHDVSGIDVSPGAVEVSRDRGVEDVRECDVAEVVDEFEPDAFETVLMLGNNFGLVGTAETAPDVLGGLATVTSDEARILAESHDVYENADDYHRVYHEYNRDRGRLPGALRIKTRYKTHATDWFDYLLVAPEEMDSVLADTVWARAETYRGENGQYVAVLEKAPLRR